MIFKCQGEPKSSYRLNIIVPASYIYPLVDKRMESYEIIIRESSQWELRADYYEGFLRGWETFSQLFQPQKDGYAIHGIPILIDD